MVPAAVGVTTIVIVALAWLARVPTLQVTVFVHEPWLEFAETKVVWSGTGSLTFAVEAELGPLFVTVSVYVRLSPTSTGSGDADFVIWRSAAVLPMVREELLLVTGAPWN